ncbi:flavodoxin domain-containing protein [Actinopolymorpha cephalotaxi]|uniref:Menaquinone-dependent protoporphyrinogen oxidase n=1 Tax=Actinopolymorpha cephalotaxi TaxID=504797 RepID=A0ABX2S7G4_9ACTN|nr:flavodoxin domain-containing protein [Actinopolymorpha cephalotaxi]NYH84437.1 menaquinone-dependent protoporphyrinogen oxidase [Actinopolymorpha cephalotaxi]
MVTTRVLVAYATRNRATAGIAERIGADLISAGLDVQVAPAKAVHTVRGYDACVLGSAIYAGRWEHDAREFADRFGDDLAGHPVWVFSSGPLDRSAEERDIPPVDTARAAAEKVHARGHRTFGGRLREDARGFFGLARRMGRRGAADYRDEQAIDSWAHELARELGADGSPTDGSPTGRPPSGEPSS